MVPCHTARVCCTILETASGAIRHRLRIYVRVRMAIHAGGLSLGRILIWLRVLACAGVSFFVCLLMDRISVGKWLDGKMPIVYAIVCLLASLYLWRNYL
jgi:hypothetical protein